MKQTSAAISCEYGDSGRDQRAFSRRPVQMTVRLSRSELRRDGANVTDLSLYGCRVQNIRASRGEAVSLKLETLSFLQATVVWAFGTTVGCKFDRPLHPAVLDHLAAVYRAETDEH